MSVAVVEPVAFDAPGFVVHLLPFLDGVDADFDAAGFEGALLVAAGRGRGCGSGAAAGSVGHGPEGRDEPVLSLAVEGLVAAEGHLEGSDAGERDVGFAGFDVVAVDGEAAGTRALSQDGGAGRGGFEGEEDSGFANLQGGVATGRHGDGEDALVDAVEIDFGVLHLGSAGPRAGGRFGRLGGIGWGIGLGRGGVGFLLVRRFLLIAFGGERGGLSLIEDGEVDGTGGGVLDGVDIEAEAFAGVGAGGEVEILTVLIEDGVEGVAHAIGDLGGFGVGERVEMDGAELVGQDLGVGQPLAVGRPGADDVTGAHLVGVLVHLDLLLGGEIDIPEAGEAIDQGDFPAVGREAGIRVKAGLQLDLHDLARAALRFQMEGVLAGFVGEIGDGFAVGRPLRIALHHAGRVSEIAGVALFGGHRNHFAACGEHRARAVG